MSQPKKQKRKLTEEEKFVRELTSPITAPKSKKIDVNGDVLWSIKASGKADHVTFQIPRDFFSRSVLRLPPLGDFIDEVTASDSHIQVRYWAAKLYDAILNGDEVDIKSFQEEELPYLYFVDVGCYIESFLYVA